MKEIVDTQILSEAFKAARTPMPRHVQISSVSAKELLLAQSRGFRKPLYFVLHPASFPDAHRFAAVSCVRQPSSPKGGALCERLTDQLVIDFGSDFPPYREYGDQALSWLINEKHVAPYKASIAHLPKRIRKYLTRRYMFLLDCDYQCLPLNANIVETAMSLFDVFSRIYTCKRDVSNTIRDLLIFATAVEHQMVLRTEDGLLGRFVARMYNAEVDEAADQMAIDFTRPAAYERAKWRGSKGYVNRGWDYAIRNSRSARGR